MNHNFKKYLLEITNASNYKELEIIQSLWSGYGNISRYSLKDSIFKTVVVKNISLDSVKEHPRGWDTANSHNRKIKSYQMETNWYQQWNLYTSSNCKTPDFIGSFSEGKNQWIVLEDLDKEYPLRKQTISFSEIKVCLKWLANFHVKFLNKKPTNLWKIGTYWHLETRSDEFKKMKESPLKNKAQLIDAELNNCQFQTIVHGDAKLANFCFSENGKEVAAVDFQYVGGGCGMKDVAYFLGSCLSSDECFLYEEELLNYYFEELKEALKVTSIPINLIELEWRRIYPFACADFTRFLLGWMPNHQKVNEYHKEKCQKVISKL